MFLNIDNMDGNQFHEAIHIAVL